MTRYVRQVECLACSYSRSFIHHLESSQRSVSQVEVQRLNRHAVLTCGRCGSTSLILAWTEDVSDAPTGIKPRIRRRRAAIAAPALTSAT